MRARWVLMATALFATACHSGRAGQAAAPRLTVPILEFVSDSAYMVRDTRLTLYRLRIRNFAAYPDSLFEPAPSLPPCGNNARASRTWADIYDRLGRRVYGFCGIARNTGLTALSFVRSAGMEPVDSVFVMLTDRKSGTSYRSNLVAIPKR